jgi:hemolysin activation/secretion protein
VIGGHNSVRGYPVASASGDSNAYLKFDYNFHIPRVMDLSREASDHRSKVLSPRFVGDFTQLDLTLGWFTDIGIVQNSDPLFFENDDKLWSAGLSLGANYKDSLLLKLEYGWALSELENPIRRVDNGDGEFYLSLIYKW